MNDTKRPSNEAITVVTAYTVAPGHSLRAGGQTYREGQQAPLNAADAKRLVESGALQVGNPAAEEAEQLVNATAAEVIESLETMDDTQLQAADEAERGRDKPRSTVLKAIEAARARLAAGDTGEE